MKGWKKSIQKEKKERKKERKKAKKRARKKERKIAKRNEERKKEKKKERQMINRMSMKYVKSSLCLGSRTSHKVYLYDMYRNGQHIPMSRNFSSTFRKSS